jgi:membrane associated rhomboid family serine protease
MQQILEQAWESIRPALSNGWAPTIGTCGAAATVLAAIWVLFRVIRTVVGILFMLCVVLLVLKVCFDIDITPWLQPLFQNIAA